MKKKNHGEEENDRDTERTERHGDNGRLQDCTTSRLHAHYPSLDGATQSHPVNIFFGTTLNASSPPFS